jgi:DNA repair protein RecN (Recombination protein N)
MLRELRICNFALIDELGVQFGPGFNVLTGETGAGKSILIDALAFLLGARAQNEQLRSGANEAVVEGSFDPPVFPEFRALMEEAGLSQESDQFLILKRHLLRDGRNKAYVNGSFVPLSTLRALGDHLADIQGQHQGQSLLEPGRQLELLDAYAGHREKTAWLRGRYQRIQRIRKELGQSGVDGGDTGKRLEFLSFQRSEIEAAQLKPGEEEEILKGRILLANAEKLFQLSETVLNQICHEPGAAADSISSAIASLRGGMEIDPRLTSSLEALQSAKIYLEEAVSSLKSYQGKIDFDPARLEELELRLSTIAKLKRKYGGSLSEVLASYEEILRKIQEIEGWAERKAQLSAELDGLLKEMAELVQEISQARKEAAHSMEEEVQRELRQLGMPQAIFQIGICQSEDPQGELAVSGKRYRISPQGIDEIGFLFSSNRGEPLKPLSKIISGGELSRATLALKTVLAALDEIPTLILDEVDVGISGSMAEVIGQKVASIGGQRQVICITHLAQIAAFGDSHFHVQKQQQGTRTLAKLKRLRESERVNEIARMLGGKGISETPLAHAREIVSSATEWKRMRDASFTAS